MEFVVKQILVIPINLIMALLLAPLMVGITNRVKSWFAGRKGPPLFQLYFDFIKWMKKGGNSSETTTFVFNFGPVISLATMIVTLAMMPGGKTPSWLEFNGDIILLVFLLLFSRYAQVLSALDTGSSLCGMGASRNAQYMVLIEPTMLLVIGVLAAGSGNLTLRQIFVADEYHNSGSTIMAVMSMAIIFLVENGRIPYDDPDTILELTMVQEGMLLEHGGPDLAIARYAASLKVWLLGMIIILMACPYLTTMTIYFYMPCLLLGMFIVSVITGVVEATMARFSFIDIPQYMLLAMGCALLSAIFLLIR